MLLENSTEKAVFLTVNTVNCIKFQILPDDFRNVEELRAESEGAERLTVLPSVQTVQTVLTLHMAEISVGFLLKLQSSVAEPVCRPIEHGFPFRQLCKGAVLMQAYEETLAKHHLFQFDLYLLPIGSINLTKTPLFPAMKGPLLLMSEHWHLSGHTAKFSLCLETFNSNAC